MISFPQQPSERLDYDVDLSEELPSTDTIVSAVPSVSPVGLTLGTTAINNTTKVVKQWISGGTNGIVYEVTVLITTSEGRTIEENFKVKVRER